MKKLLYTLALLMGCVACNEEESITTEERPMTETETRVQNLINTYSDYDPYAVEELLTNKLLTLDAYLEYDSRWDRIVAEPYAFGVKNDPEFTPDRYLLREDGTAAHYTLEESVWVTTEGTWSFDAASQTLRLLEQEEHIIALTPSSIIWDKETTNVPGGKPRFYRIIYKVSEYDPNQPNPTPDTVYEPIEVRMVTQSQFSNSYFLFPVYNPYVDRYDWCSLIYIFFPESEINKTLSDIIYFKLETENPSELYIHWEHEENGWNKMTEKNNDLCYESPIHQDLYTDCLFQQIFGLVTSGFGTQNFRVIIYDLESDRYFITEKYKYSTFKDQICYVEKL